MNWVPPEGGEDVDDWVGLFKREPTNPVHRRSPDLLVGIDPTVHRGGYFKTELKMSEWSTMPSSEPLCIGGLWIAYIRGEEILLTNCLRLHPEWMWEMRDIIGDTPLHALMIPGTHNSGSYVSNDGNPLLNSFSATQDEGVLHQLVHGIRFLDLRVSYYGSSPEKFWVVHDFVLMNPLYRIVQDIRRFARMSRDILIVDFHRFPGSDSFQRHMELVAYLTEELGEFFVPDWLGSNLTPNRIWNLNKSIVLTYANHESSDFNPLLWPEVEHSWGNAQTPQDLKIHLEEGMLIPRTHMWAAMTHLTPSGIDFVLNPQKQFRSLSNLIARNVTSWYRDLWWDSSNIVATDFFLGNNIIQESIRANGRRELCQEEG